MSASSPPRFRDSSTGQVIGALWTDGFPQSIIGRSGSDVTMDIRGWLRGLGLEQYEAAFRENEIDGEVLPKLTAEDLKDLGVVIVGHRRKILAAVAELPGFVRAPNPTVTPNAEAAPASAAVAERRQLTVMFCDLVGSTALSARLDPEDMRDVVRAYHDACSGAIARHDGFVAKFMGDGVLVYFGYPQAHEDGAERAVRASLEIVATVGKLHTPSQEKLTVRIGIATGVVIVGDHIGHGSAREQMVVGDTPNLAARLQALAQPGSVLVAESTRRLIGGSFALKALGPHALKGFGASIPVWAVVRELESVSRFDSSRSETMTPFVGREEEVDLLVDRWRGATAGEGQVVLLSGEAGIGKSRIVATLRERIGAERHLMLRYQCSPQRVNDAFFPIVGQIWHAAGFRSDDPAAARLDKLEAMIAQSGLEANAIIPYVASLLLIPTDGRYPPLELTPSDVREQTIAALVDLFVGLTKDATVLALLEDAHWIDPTSLDVFGRVIERLQKLRALIVVTFRPEFAPPWLGRSHVTALTLNRFARAQAMAMIDRITGSKPLPTEVAEQIVSKTDGVPLFVEELTKTVLESDLLREERGSFALVNQLPHLAIPSTLQDSLMARLDRLGPVKEIAQIGAVIGRNFSHRLLEAVSPISGPALREALGKLVASELIHGHGIAPEEHYVFKHALVQDTAYSSLLRSRRRGIHAEIARVLTERVVEETETSPAIVAHHYTEADMIEPAANSWLAAAELSLSRSAHAEAEQYVAAGLAQTMRLPDGPSRRTIQLTLQMALGNALLPLKGFSAPETLEALESSKKLLEEGVGSDLQRFSVLSGLCMANYIAARLEPALGLARQLVDVANRQTDSIYRLVAYRLLGTIQVLMGRFREALNALQHAEQYRDPLRDKKLSFRFSADPGLLVVCWKAWALMFLGCYDEAMKVGTQARSGLSSHGHSPTVAMVTFVTVVVSEYMCGDLAEWERQCKSLVDFCVQNKVANFQLVGRIHLAGAKAMRDPTDENVAALRAVMRDAQTAGARTGHSGFLCQVAEALLIANDLAGADAALQEGFAFVEETGERWSLANLHRLSGHLAFKQSNAVNEHVERCFLLAIEVAGQQEARLLQLHSATDLARIWRIEGSTRDPRALLEPILASIEGGEAARDVRVARAFLREIAC